MFINYFQFSSSHGQHFPLVDAVSIVPSGVLLLSAQAFDVHCIHLLNQLLLTYCT